MVNKTWLEREKKVDGIYQLAFPILALYMIASPFRWCHAYFVIEQNESFFKSKWNTFPENYRYFPNT